ncbi:hypothetical protein ACWEGE_12450 [Amycolatopsis sp. NPDC004747]
MSVPFVACTEPDVPSVVRIPVSAQAASGYDDMTSITHDPPIGRARVGRVADAGSGPASSSTEAVPGARSIASMA